MIFFVRWRIKSYPLGGPGGNCGPVLILPWRCNFSIYSDIQVYYLDIQAITTLLCLILVLMCCFLLFIQFSMLKPLSWKVTCSGTQKPKTPRVCFGPTRMWLGSFWRGIKWLFNSISTDLFLHKFLFNKFINLLFLVKNLCDVQKIV